MSTDKNEIFLSQYTPPNYLVESVELRVELDPQATRVQSRLRCRPNPASVAFSDGPPPLQLDVGRLQLCRLALEGIELAPSQYQLSGAILQVPVATIGPLVLEVETIVNPSANTALEGLYLSAGNYCTQCEAEGFRSITCFPDRPDVMAVFTVTLIADQQQCPVLLANGNLVASGELPEGRHYATWHDPFPKPSYLFAMVAGRLVCKEEHFTTCTGRDVTLQIYVEERNREQCDHAMQALRKSMRWDEQHFGREYDLDRYMIVAVDDFNMGAMENKGLNVFNSKYVLALPETATDADYEGIEAVIAHEYFHNWSGNRITCRDWFQLSLKEGLTVFRDQEFTADQLSGPVKRIQDANIIRSFQFREDSGPMAHPVRPPSFVEINNFYTLTVYNKGAEVIRMLHTLLGPERFRQGMDLYFERHDGQAVTCDDFVAAMASAWGRELEQFKRWYSQAGTPELSISADYVAAHAELRLQVQQHCPATREAAEKEPFFLPFSLGLLDAEGQALPLIPGDATTRAACLERTNSPGNKTQVLLIDRDKQEFVFTDIKSPPVLSLLRNFSAPVKLNFTQSEAELSLLMSHDSDPFNRWDAGQRLGLQAILEQIETPSIGTGAQLPQVLESLRVGMARLLADEQADPAFLAQALLLPTENWISQHMAVVDPVAVFTVRRRFSVLLADALQAALLQRYAALKNSEPYQYTRRDAGRRALRNCCLGYLLVCDESHPAAPEHLELALKQYRQSDNMTESFAALQALVNADAALGTELLADFYQRHQQHPLLVDKWLGLQAACTLPGTLQRVRELTQHPTFSYTIPNKVRALVAVFCTGNHAQFHAADGSGYRFLGEQVALLDPLNPQIATRMLSPLTQWRRYDSQRQQLMYNELEQLASLTKVSDDLREVLERSLA